MVAPCMDLKNIGLLYKIIFFSYLMLGKKQWFKPKHNNNFQITFFEVKKTHDKTYNKTQAFN